MEVWKHWDHILKLLTGGETPINKESNIWEKNLLKMKVK